MTVPADLVPADRPHQAPGARRRGRAGRTRRAGQVPTADLETLDPGKADEDALGVTYEEIDDFLEGKPVPEQTFEKILTALSGRPTTSAGCRSL